MTSDTQCVISDTQIMAEESLTLLKRAYDRMCEASECEDEDMVRWLWKRLVSLERATQEREAK